MSLKRPVPYTSRAKPGTCSHLKVSQPSPRLTSQMKSVRQVSIVLRAVALMDRVTERPKKLKPLCLLSAWNYHIWTEIMYPIEIMIRTLLTAMALLWKIS